MNDVFEKRVRAAAVTGWWVVLIFWGFLFLQWFGYLVIMHARPEWMLSWCGPDITWPFVENAWFWAVVVLKLCMWLMVLAALWLTLWARQLRKCAGSP